MNKITKECVRMFKKIIFLSMLSVVFPFAALADSCPPPSSLSMSGGYVVGVDSVGYKYQSTMPYPNHNPANSNFFTVNVKPVADFGSTFVTGNPHCHYEESDNTAFVMVSSAMVTPSGHHWQQHGPWAGCDSNAHIPAQCPYQ